MTRDDVRLDKALLLPIVLASYRIGAALSGAAMLLAIALFLVLQHVVRGRVPAKLSIETSR
jgi:hypothetical protein